MSVADAHHVLDDFDQTGLAALQSEPEKTDCVSLCCVYYAGLFKAQSVKKKKKKNASWQAVSPCDLNI